MTLEFSYLAAGEHETEKLGRALAQVLTPGTTIGLVGTLGAGKTRFVQAVARGLAVAEDVMSPTFVLCHEYQGRLPLFHLDTYRLHDEDEFLELGPEEYFDSPGVTMVEWADRVENCLPTHHLRVEIEVAGATSRRFRFGARGEQHEQILVRLRQELP